MGATRRGQLCLALLCVLHVQSGSAAVPRTAASQPRPTDDGVFEKINEQVQVMTGLLEDLSDAVADVTTVSPPPSTTSPSPVPTDPSTTPSSVTTDASTTPSSVTTDASTTPSSVTTDASTTPSSVTTDPSTTPSSVTTDASTTLSKVATAPGVESNPGDHEPIYGCEQAQKDVTTTLIDEANEALELVANEVFTQDTLDALKDSNNKINITVDCTKSGKIQLTEDLQSDLRNTIKDTQKTADEAEKTIDNIINPTPEPLPSLAISSPFMIVLITFSCLLAVVALVGVAMLVSRSVQGPPAAGKHRRPTSGRVNAGYRPTETDTTELVERPGGRRRATTAAAAPTAPTAPAVSADPDRYDRLYEGAIPRAHASSPPNAGRSWDGELQQPAGQSAPPARREFYNAY